MPITHIAANSITLEGRFLRQRCAWCGCIIIDNDLSRMEVALNPDGTVPPPPRGWECSRLEYEKLIDEG